MTDAAQLHGPGGLLATAGLSTRRKARRWGRCTCATVKESLGPGITRIRGNLCNVHGKYGPCDAALSGKKKPKKGRAAKPKQTPEQRAEARAQQRQQNIDAVAKRMADTDTGLSPSGVKALTAFAQGQQPSKEQGAQLVAMGLAERADDGSYRMTPTARSVISAMEAGDYQRAVDAVSRAGDTASRRRDRQTAQQQRQQTAAQRRADVEAKRQQRQAEQAKRNQERTQAKPAKQGGSKQPAQPRKTVAQRLRRSGGSTPSTGGASPSAPKPKQPAKAEPQIDQKLRDAASKLAEGQDVSDAEMQQLITNGLVKLNKDGQPVLTAVGQRATMKETFGGVRRSNLDDSVFAGPDRSFPIVTAQDVRDAVRSLGRTKHDKAAVKRGIIRRARAIGATDALPESWREKSFAVFKDHTGAYRWIARTTTAYRDRDGEIISEAALDQDSQRMMATKQFGPLRWWHVGMPDRFDPATPWGPGLDIGDCDYSVVIGRTRIESGTFRNAVIAQKMARIADRLEMSPGFFHLESEPDAGKVYNQMRTFERSPVPTRYGRASNLFTGFTVKEFQMKPEEMERRFKAMISELQLSPEQAQIVAGDLVATEKAAAEQGIAFKSEQAPAEITINGVVYTVKAEQPTVEVAEKAMAPASMEQAGETEIADAAAEQMDDGDGMDDELVEDADVIGNMSIADFESMLGALLDARLAPQEKMADMLKQMGDMHGELKTMYSGAATKDAGNAAEIAALKEAQTQLAQQQAQIAQRLLDLSGDQPAVTLPSELEAALKSAGPADPPEADPSKPIVPNDPNRPFASLAAQTAPWLYNENGWHQSAS